MNLALGYSPDPNPDLLKILKIPVERGRFLTAQDKHDTPPVIVIDEDFARLYFGKEDPIGKRVNFALLGMSAEIVGIVGPHAEFSRRRMRSAFVWRSAHSRVTFCGLFLEKD